MKRHILATALLCAAPAWAQQSASFRLTEHTFNQGGRPRDGAVATSTSFRITLDAIGDSTAAEPSGSSFAIHGGLLPALGPVGEVLELRFDDATGLSWQALVRAETYNVYRDGLGTLSGLGYGGCLEASTPGTTHVDPTSPGAADGFFYLVTARNRLGEEGTKGRDSAGVERANAAPCP